jgi:Restriction endonuclease
LGNSGQPKRKKRNGKTAEAKLKGDLLEDVVGGLYEAQDLKVSKRVNVPAMRDATRSREVDVLVEGSFAGYPVRIAIECKNYEEPVGIDKIDSFVAKLQDIGIPPQYGIFVSVNGFQGNAIPRAREAGIRTLVLDGLTKQRLSYEVREAFRSVVYLLLKVQRLSVTTGEIADGDGSQLLWFTDSAGKISGGLLDLVWSKWINREIPWRIGESTVSIQVPPEWRWASEALDQPNSAEATVQVVGLVVTDRGEANHLTLYDAESGVLDRGKVNIRFDDGPRSLPVSVAATEDELEALLDNSGEATVTIGRLPLPRIVYKMYWPPSSRAWRCVARVVEETHRATWTKIRDFGMKVDPLTEISSALQALTFEQIEGTDLSAIWDPIIRAHPASNDPDWPTNIFEATGEKSIDS